LFFDLDIFSVPPISTGWPSAFSGEPGGPCRRGQVHVGRVEPGLLAGGVFAVVGLVQHHALRQQVGEGLVELDQAEVAHDLGPEARVQQVQDGVFDAADVLVHRHPVIVASSTIASLLPGEV
jgi:hypothetical protein